MKSATISIAILALLGTAAAAEGEYSVVATDNPAYRPNTLFSEPEDLSSARFEGLARRYRLDKLVEGEADEFRRILLLRSWLNHHVAFDRSKPGVGKEALEMLAESPKGGYYHCGHFMTMQQAILSAMGHVARPMFAGAGKRGPLSGSHGMNEVWVNSLQKWILVDAEHDAHFEIDGRPLSGLEIRNEIWKDGGARLVKVTGPDRQPQPGEKPDSWGRTPHTYTWISWYPEANLHSRWPKRRSSQEIVVVDDIWRANIWYRDNKKHFAYDADLFVPIANPNIIYWTPNVLKVDAIIDGNSAEIAIESDTPNLKEYQIRAPSGEWRATEAAFTLELAADRHQWQLRSVNLASVTGPVYQLIIARKQYLR